MAQFHLEVSTKFVRTAEFRQTEGANSQPYGWANGFLDGSAYRCCTDVTQA